MELYRLKHKPSGLYYQPSSNSSNLSEKGKIYTTKNNALSSAIRSFERYGDDHRIFRISFNEKCNILKKYTKLLELTNHEKYYGLNIKTDVINDWEKEFIKIENK